MTSMKKVKDLKVGDKVFLYSSHLSPDAGFVIKSIKKQKTLAIVTIDWDALGKHKDIICYGHVSGELLVYNGAGFDSTIPLVCDYQRIIEKTKEYEREYGQKKIGRAVQELVSALKGYGNAGKLALF